MSKNKKHIFIYGSLLLLAGCANYKASSLSYLYQDPSIQSSKNSNVVVAWKIFGEEDCETYLDRNVIEEGYVPVQMTIKNDSADPVFLSVDHFNVPLARPQQVAEKVHTSTATRITAWGVGGLFIWPLLIPAVCDGIKSVKANQSLDEDYRSKALTETTIFPQTSFNGLVFIPKQQMEQSIEMFLVNERTQDKITFRVHE